MNSLSLTSTILLITVTTAYLSSQHYHPFTKFKSKTTPLHQTNKQIYENMGLNELQTELRKNISKENYKEASVIKTILSRKTSTPTKSWSALGCVPWLIDRLDALEYVIPTTIQINSMECINAMLACEGTLEERVEQMEDKLLSTIISGSTGSGKSLSFLIPTLSMLSNKLFQRQRIRIKAEEDVVDIADDILLNNVIQITSPEILNKGVSGGTKVESLGRSSGYNKESVDIKHPLCLILVPSRELGVQMANLVYELVGGNIKKNIDDYFASKRNMFKYKGPKGVKIGCILDDNEAEYGLKLQTDVVITTPHYLTKLLHDGDIKSDLLQVVILDEADLVLEQLQSQDLSKILHSDTNLKILYLVGASVTKKTIEKSLPSDITLDTILPTNGRSYMATATDFAPLTIDETENTEKSLSIKQLKLSLDPGLIHERLITPPNTSLLYLCRMLRHELNQYTQNTTKQEPRIIIFYPDEPSAKKSLPKIRDALWNQYKLCALLPTIGFSPLDIMEQYKNEETSVMLATPNSVRGLDFPNVTHVYSVNYVPEDVREYIHLAGRVGRIGQGGSGMGVGGRITSIVCEDGAGRLEELSKVLGFEFVELDRGVFDRDGLHVELREEEEDVDWSDLDVEDMRRYLEDKITLLDDDEDDNKE